VSGLKSFTGPMRLPFLILTPACVLLGYATARYATDNVNALYFWLALVGTVTAHTQERHRTWPG